MIREVVSGGTLFALIADASDIGNGIQPLTKPELPLQALMRRHPQGHRVPKHSHKKVSKSTEQLNEGLVVLAGSLSVTVADAAGKDIGTYAVSSGQCLLMFDGWHEIHVTEDTVFFEFKNGPYVEDKIS